MVKDEFREMALKRAKVFVSGAVDGAEDGLRRGEEKREAAAREDMEDMEWRIWRNMEEHGETSVPPPHHSMSR